MTTDRAAPDPRPRPAGEPGEPTATDLGRDAGEDPLRERAPEPEAEESVRRGSEDGAITARDESDREEGERDPGL